MPFNHYNSNLKEKARQLRQNSTQAEIRMWIELLRAKKMCGYTFNRQRIIDRYIVDFYCKKLRLIVEIDGWTHSDIEVAKKDAIRQERLESLGYHFIRFTDVEVFHDLEDVRFRLEERIRELEKAGTEPSA